jgi:hypothetical protein
MALVLLSSYPRTTHKIRAVDFGVALIGRSTWPSSIALTTASPGRWPTEIEGFTQLISAAARRNIGPPGGQASEGPRLRPEEERGRQMAPSLRTRSRRARLGLTSIAAAVVLFLGAAAPVALAKAPGPQGFVGTFAMADPATGAAIYYQVAVGLRGNRTSPDLLSGRGAIAVCNQPPDPITPYACAIDIATLAPFDATGARTTDPASGQSVLTWVVKAPGPGQLPGGTSAVTVYRAPGPQGFTLTFPDGSSVVGSGFILN